MRIAWKCRRSPSRTTENMSWSGLLIDLSYALLELDKVLIWFYMILLDFISSLMVIGSKTCSHRTRHVQTWVFQTCWTHLDITGMGPQDMVRDERAGKLQWRDVEVKVNHLVETATNTVTCWRLLVDFMVHLAHVGLLWFIMWINRLFTEKNDLHSSCL